MPNCTECTTEYELVYDSEQVLWIKYPPGRPISFPRDIVPIFAGYPADGERAYLMMDGGDTGYTLEAHKSDRGKDTRELYLPILRYTPNMCPRYYGSRESGTIPKDALDATGPFYWKFVQNLSRIQEIDNEVVETHSGNRDILSHADDGLADSSSCESDACDVQSVSDLANFFVTALENPDPVS